MSNYPKIVQLLKKANFPLPVSLSFTVAKHCHCANLVGPNLRSDSGATSRQTVTSRASASGEGDSRSLKTVRAIGGCGGEGGFRIVQRQVEVLRHEMAR